MYRLALALTPLVLVTAAACGSKSAPATPSTGSGGPPPIAKKVSISWGLSELRQGGATRTDVYLAMTDERASQVSHPIGRYDGACSVIAPAKEMNALTGVRCVTGGLGTELHAVSQGGDQVIVLRMQWAEGAPVDPMAREEAKRIPVPLGVAIYVDPVASTTGAP